MVRFKRFLSKYLDITMTMRIYRFAQFMLLILKIIIFEIYGILLTVQMVNYISR